MRLEFLGALTAIGVSSALTHHPKAPTPTGVDKTTGASLPKKRATRLQLELREHFWRRCRQSISASQTTKVYLWTRRW